MLRFSRGVAERRPGAVLVMAVLLVLGFALVVRWHAGRSLAAPQPVAAVAGAVLDRDGPDPAVSSALQRSVLRVHASGCGQERQATVTLVRRADTVVGLTNQHVVAGTDRVDVDGVAGSVDVSGVVADRDVAEVDGAVLSDGGAEPLEAGPRPVLGSRVMVAGYPDGRFLAASGTVRSVEARQGYGATTEVMVVDVDAVPGISGGVVIDVTGRAVGLVAASDPVTHDVVAYPLDAIGAADPALGAACRPADPSATGAG